MGSVFEYIPIEKAVEALGVQRRQIYNLIKNGRLRSVKRDRKTFVYREDVARIIEDREQRTVPVPLSRETVRQHEARIHMLEKKVTFLMRLSDLHHDPLGLTAVELGRFHDVAENCLAGNWPPQMEATWADMFVRLQVEDLDKLLTVRPDINPWLTFYSLCRVMLRRPLDPENELDLRAGKKNLETIAYVWSTTEGMTAKDLEAVTKNAEKTINKAVRRVTRARAKN